MKSLSVTGRPAEIDRLLQEMAPCLNALDRPDLGGRTIKVTLALQGGTYLRTDWIRSPLYRELDEIHQAIERGDPVEEALKGKLASDELNRRTGPLDQTPRSITARPHRTPLGPPPIIHWKKYGSDLNPAFETPPPHINTAGLRLGFTAQQIAGRAFSYAAMKGENRMDPHIQAEHNIVVESFYGISPEHRRRLREGFFVPEELSRFPSTEAGRLIERAGAFEPLYGELMRHLVQHAIFESQGWSLGIPLKDSPWHLIFRYELRCFVANQLLSENGKKAVLADKTLMKVVKDEVSFEESSWHRGRTRREVLESWFALVYNGHPELAGARRLSIGNVVLKLNGWTPPPGGSPESVKLQWMVRYWAAHYHYGVIPTRGLPIDRQRLEKFVVQAVGNSHDAAKIFVINNTAKKLLLNMMGDFYTPEELSNLRVNPRNYTQLPP
jgi:hypothetical protein